MAFHNIHLYLQILPNMYDIYHFINQQFNILDMNPMKHMLHYLHLKYKILYINYIYATKEKQYNQLLFHRKIYNEERT